MACKQCGKCCEAVGRTFWKNGDYEDCPELNNLANNGDYEDNGQPCEMLSYDRDKAVCSIEEKIARYLGLEPQGFPLDPGSRFSVGGVSQQKPSFARL